MNWFHDLKIATKLLISFLIVLLLTVFLGLFSVMQLADVRENSQEISGVWMLGVVLLSDLNTDTSDFRLAQFQRIQATTPEQRAHADRNLEQELNSVQKGLAEYERSIISEEDRRLFTTFKEGWERYVRKDPQLQQLSTPEQREQARKMMLGELREDYDTVNNKLAELVVLNRVSANAAAKRADTPLRTTRRRSATRGYHARTSRAVASETQSTRAAVRSTRRSAGAASARRYAANASGTRNGIRSCTVTTARRGIATSGASQGGPTPAAEPTPSNEVPPGAGLGPLTGSPELDASAQQCLTHGLV